MKKNILILAPHADDEILGCGGAISKYKNLGYCTHVLILTNANIGAPDLYSAKKINLIRDEAKRANKTIGTQKLYFENLPGLNLNQYPTYKISNIISKYILKIDPEILFIPSANDIHDDHKKIFHASKVAVRPKKKNNLKKILSYEVLSETEWNEDEKSFNPNYFINLTKNNVNKKIKAFLKYKSQVQKFPHPRSLMGIEILARYRGMQSHCNYSEAFKLEREIA